MSASAHRVRGWGVHLGLTWQADTGRAYLAGASPWEQSYRALEGHPHWSPLPWVVVSSPKPPTSLKHTLQSVRHTQWCSLHFFHTYLTQACHPNCMALSQASLFTSGDFFSVGYPRSRPDHRRREVMDARGPLGDTMLSIAIQGWPHLGAS